MKKFEVVAIGDLSHNDAGGHVYQATDELVNAEARFLKEERLYVANPASPGFPVDAPLYFAVDVARQPGCECPCPCPPPRVSGVTQTVWNDPDGLIWRRLGSVVHPDGQEPSVQWGLWKKSESATDCDCRPMRITGPTDFYIREDGDDTTGDGLTEATALATWEGFYNKYVAGPAILDANFHTVTINFGPGRWTGEIALHGATFQRRGRVIIKGAGMGQTFLSNPNGGVFTIGEGLHRDIDEIQDFTLDGFARGIQITGCSVYVNNVKFTTNNAQAQGIILGLGGQLVVSSDGSVNSLYFENFKGNYAINVQAGSRANLHTSRIVVTGTCTWTAFICVQHHSMVWAAGLSVQGTGTGQRFYMSHHSTIRTTGNNRNLFPGTVAGEVGTVSFGYYY